MQRNEKLRKFKYESNHQFILIYVSSKHDTQLNVTKIHLIAC